MGNARNKRCTIPKKGIDYIKKVQNGKRIERYADEQTVRQFDADMITLALNDEGFGRERIKRVLEAWSKKHDLYAGAFTKAPDADYKREKLDEELHRIMQDDFQPFLERYDWVPDIKTGVK